MKELGLLKGGVVENGTNIGDSLHAYPITNLDAYGATWWSRTPYEHDDLYFCVMAVNDLCNIFEGYHINTYYIRTAFEISFPA